MTALARWRPLLIAVGVLLVAALLGVGLGDAALLAAVALVLTTVYLTLAAGQEYEWPEARLEATDGTRRDIAALTWTFVGRDGRVSEAAVRRLREVAARRLARHGVPLAGFAEADQDVVGGPARELLGERAWATLSTPGGYMPTLGEVAHCVTVLEQLPDRITNERPHP